MATSVQIVIDCTDPDRLATFWAAALGYQKQFPPVWTTADRAVADTELVGAICHAPDEPPRDARHVRIGRRWSVAMGRWLAGATASHG